MLRFTLARSTTNATEEEEFTLQPFPDLAHTAVGFHFYEASHLLAAYLMWNLKPPSAGNRRVLELGSGSCGLAGLAMAKLGSNSYHVTFTDLELILPYLTINVERNLGPPVGHYAIEQLLWGTGNFAAPETPYDFIVAADCTYLRTSVQPLMETIAACLSKRGECYLAHEEREEGLDQYVEQQAKSAGLRVRKIKPANHPPPFHPAADGGGGGGHLKLFKLVKM